MSKKGPRYVVYDSDDVKHTWNERKLRGKIRSRDLAGDELVRREEEPEGALRPLFQDPIFQDVHNVGPEQAQLVTHANRARGFAGHAITFLAVGAFLGFPWWMVFWGLGLATHGMKTMGAMDALRADPQGKAALLGQDLSATVGGEPVEEPPTPAADALSNEALREWKRLEAVLDRAGDETRATIEAAKGRLDTLLDRHRDLSQHLDGEVDTNLDQERAELEVDLSVDGLDARTREVLEGSLAAIDKRRAATAEARAAAGRARARARAVLHQLKSLRLYLVTHDDPSADEDLGKLVADLQEQTEATAELEEALAQARTPRRQKA